MKKLDLSDILEEADYDLFLKFFEQDKVNLVTSLSTLNNLELTLIYGTNPIDRIKIVKHLIASGIDVNYIDKKNKRNALHYLFSNVTRADISFYLDATKILIENGININQRDKYGAIPLSYAIANVKLDSETLKPLYMMLLENGSNYNDKDDYGNSCLDYASKFSWRNEFLEFVKEFENERRQL